MSLPPLTFQGMPNISTPVINPDGTMNFTWYRFFQSVYKITGLGTPGIAVTGGNDAEFGYRQVSPAFGCKEYSPPTQSQLFVYDQITGIAFGYIDLTIP